MDKLLWLDLEMSGLDVEKERILELAAIVTDWDFKELGEFHRIIYQDKNLLDEMDAWCVAQHQKSGLTKAVLESQVSEEKAEAEFGAWLDEYFSKSERIVLCGNSIGTDKIFVEKYFKSIAPRLHYRLLDVSSWKLVFRHKFAQEFKKGEAHRAVDDIRESIDELKFYLSYLDQDKVKKTKGE